MNAADQLTRHAIALYPVARRELRLQLLGWIKLARAVAGPVIATVKPTKGLRKLGLKPANGLKRKDDSPILTYAAVTFFRVIALVSMISIFANIFHPIINLAMMIGIARTVGARSTAAPVRVSWKTSTGLTAAMIRTGLIAKVKEGARQPTVTVDVTQDDEYGTAVKVRLPSPLVVADVVKKEAQLAREIGKPLDDLEIGGLAGHDPGTLEIFAVKPGRKVAKVVLPTATNVQRPISLGRDRRGGVVDTRLILPGNGSQNMIIGGHMGSGKSYLIRRLMAHYLLDPAADVIVYGGKGLNDFAAVRHACQAMYSGTKADSIPQLEEKIEELILAVSEHNDGGKKCRPTLVVLDEFQTIFSYFGEKELKEFVKRLYKLMTESRSAYMSFILASQQWRADTVPSKIRSVCPITVSLQCRNGDERLIHGETMSPAISVPRSPGQAIIGYGGHYRYVQTDHLTDHAWDELGDRLPKVITEPGDHTINLESPVIIDPLIEFTRQALASCGDLSAADLLPLIPEQIRPADPARLGHALGKHGIRSTMKNKRRVYDLASLQGGKE